MTTLGDFKETVRQQADIVRIVGDYVQLRKAGAQNYIGLCPFHSEKSPSFSVHQTRQFFHCFGCGKSGDVFKFLQEREQISFFEAVRMVAEKVGIPLPKTQYNSESEAGDAKQRGQLLEMHERACRFFENQLRRPEGGTCARISGWSRVERRDDQDVWHRLCAGFRFRAERSSESRFQR